MKQTFFKKTPKKFGNLIFPFDLSIVPKGIQDCSQKNSGLLPKKPDLFPKKPDLFPKKPIYAFKPYQLYNRLKISFIAFIMGILGITFEKWQTK